MFEFAFSLFPLFFLLVACIMIFSIVKNIGEWKNNNHSPVLTVEAYVTSKRTSVTQHQHQTGTEPSSFILMPSTTYYVTFQVASGDRIEFHVNGAEYGMLAERDTGRLTFQGSRYISFNRQEINFSGNS